MWPQSNPGKAVPQGSMFPVDSGLHQVDSRSCNEGYLLPTGEKGKRVLLNKMNKSSDPKNVST